MKTSNIVKAFIILLILLLLGTIGAGALYLKNQSVRTTFFPNTTVNGYDASELTPAQVTRIIEADYSSSGVTLSENEETALSGSLADFGYVVDDEKLQAGIDALLNKQNNSPLNLVNGLFAGNTFSTTIPFIFKQETLQKAVKSDLLPTERIPSTDAAIKYNEEENYYYIEPEKYGTEFADSDLQSYVQSQLDTFVSGNNPGADCSIDFPTDIYTKPSVLSDNASLNTTVRVFNQFCKAKITYTFGKQKEVLDWGTIQNWLRIVDGEGVLDDESLYNFVVSLEARYDTRHLDRTFHTSVGTDIVIPSAENDYGYSINEDEEFRQLVADIRSNTEVTRTPVYIDTTSDYGNPVYYQREGKDDLVGTYVEVNLTTQHLWFYKDYQVIVDTDIVSGCVAKKAETKTGAFPLAYKESPSVLVGADAADGYRTEVQYWMPFFEGQGLHDAKWRGAFGGNIYITNGSHGCVNMPPAQAQILFEHVKEGMAIIIYK